MGLTQTNGHGYARNQFVNFTSLNWELRPNTTKRTEYGEFNTYRNRYTQEEIDRYDLFFASHHEEENYYHCLMERLREDYIVNTVYYERKDEGQICGRLHRGEAYIQHIPVRLCDVTDIPFPENVYMLRLTLLGFEKLYQKVGYFEVKEDLVCIDKEGTVRVWMNSDLSKNYPEGIEKDGEGSKDGERLMVGEIVSMIDRNTEQLENQNLNLNLYFQNNGTKYPTFVEALNFINSFVQEYSIKLPTYCHSIIEIFREDYGAEFNILEEDEEMFMEGIMGSQPDPIRENVLSPQIHQTEHERVEERPAQQYTGNYNLQTQQSERSNQSGGSRGFMLSQIKENTSRDNMPLYSPQNNDPVPLQNPQVDAVVSSPRVTFSYQSNANANYMGHENNPPLTYPYQNQYLHAYQYHPYKIQQRSQKSSIDHYPPKIDYISSKVPKIGNELSKEFDQQQDMEIDPEIYADMLKYL